MMTPEEAKANQDRIAEHYKLGWWYGVNCKKCHGVYPKFMNTNDMNKCFYQCEVCGRKTGVHDMPKQAEDDWNSMTGAVQTTIFDFMENYQ